MVSTNIYRGIRFLINTYRDFSVGRPMNQPTRVNFRTGPKYHSQEVLFFNVRHRLSCIIQMTSRSIFFFFEFFSLKRHDSYFF